MEKIRKGYSKIYDSEEGTIFEIEDIEEREYYLPFHKFKKFERLSVSEYERDSDLNLSEFLHMVYLYVKKDRKESFDSFYTDNVRGVFPYLF